jgi:hypothetical protein
MKKLMLVVLALAMLLPMAAMAQTGTLAVSATVASSINLVFNTGTNGVTLGGDGTSTATLAFGSVSAYGTLNTNVGRSVGANAFTVSTPVGVTVAKYNSASANYTLKAQLASTDAVNTWTVGGTAVTGAAQATITSTGAYGSAAQESVAITVPFASASLTAISNTLNFTASAN